MPYRRRDNHKHDYKIKVELELWGGKLNVHYVAELIYLCLSGPGEHPDDYGYGDFIVETFALLSKGNAETRFADQREAKNLPKWVFQSTQIELRDIPSVQQWQKEKFGEPLSTNCYPHLVLADWTQEQIEQFEDLFLGIGVRAVYSRSSWEVVVDVLKLMVDACLTVWKAYGGDYVGAVSSFSNFVGDAMKMSDQKRGREVEYFGECALQTGKKVECQWGIMHDGKQGEMFEMAAGSRIEHALPIPEFFYNQLTREDERSGIVTVTNIFAEKNWVQCGVRIRKASEVYSISWVDSIQFTTTDNPCPKWGYGEIYGLYNDSGFYSFSPLEKDREVAWGRGPFKEGTDFDKFDEVNLPYGQSRVYWWQNEEYGTRKNPWEFVRDRIKYSGLNFCKRQYLEFHLHLCSWSPGDRPTPIGSLDFTFYLEDFLRKAGTTLDFPDKNFKVTFSREGPLFCGDYELKTPGLYLDKVKFRVYACIWEEK